MPKNKYDVAAYVWPAYTGDEIRTRIFWPEGMGEWESVKKAVKKFPEHSWPRKPLWGYVNEADPYVMEMQINAASDHGVNVFIYDWYWYDNRPFLENCLNDGFLKAKNNDRMSFYLMWANHTVSNIWDIRNSGLDKSMMIWDGAVNRSQFETICERIIEKYFFHPSYYKIDGKPVFSIYDLATLIRGLGGVQEVKRAFDWLRDRAVKAGLPGLHIQLIKWGITSYNLSGVDGGEVANAEQVIHTLEFDSMTYYQICHFTNINRDYEKIIPDVVAEWKTSEKAYKIPLFPHVSVGWDTNPRYTALRPGIITNNTPENIEIMLRHAKEYIDCHKNQPPLVTINSWNEWAETSYLQPDDLYGYGYLEAVKRVFVD